MTSSADNMARPTAAGEQDISTQLSERELAVATVLDVVADLTKRAVRRTMLQAIIDAAHERPAGEGADPIASLDREEVSNALLSLRASHLAVLEETGFRLTKSGETKVEDSQLSEPTFYKELQGLVGSKLTEWSIAT